MSHEDVCCYSDHSFDGPAFRMQSEPGADHGRDRGDREGEYSFQRSGPVTESEDFSMDPIAIPGISIGDKHFTLYFDSNSSAEEFFEKIKKEHLVITMKDQGGVEKIGDLPWTLTANDEAVTAGPGDILLYQGNRLSICYSESSTNSTKIGHIPYYDDFGDFSEVLGKGDTTVDFTVVWTE